MPDVPIKYNISPKFSKEVLSLFEDLQVDFFLAGGFVLTEVQKSQGIQSTSSDIDVYFYTEEDYDKAYNITQDYIDVLNKDIKDFTQNIYIQSTSTSDTIDLSTKIQLVNFQYGKPEKLTKDFDLNNSRYWSYFPFTEAWTFQDKDTLRYLKTSMYKNVFTMKRIHKYKEQKNISSDNYTERCYDVIMNNTYEFDNISYDQGITKESKENEKMIYFNALISCDVFIEYLNNHKAPDYKGMFKGNTFLVHHEHLVNIDNPLALFYMYKAREIYSKKYHYKNKYNQEETKIKENNMKQIQKDYPEVLL